MRQVQLKGVEVSLGLPDSMAWRTEIWLASADNQLRAGAAALAACWQSSHKPKVNYAACGYSVPVFGGQVYNWLIDRGVPQAEIWAASSAALDLIFESLPHSKAVDEAVGFTSEEGTGSPSSD